MHAQPSESLRLTLADADATTALAMRLAPLLRAGAVLWLQGELGAGKTSFARALLQALGVRERIKSPTYSLVEHYQTAAAQSAWHLDLYRIGSVRELDELGLDALREPAALVLIEWPERGVAALPPADLQVSLVHAGAGRQVQLQACSTRARQWLSELAAARDA